MLLPDTFRPWCISFSYVTVYLESIIAGSPVREKYYPIVRVIDLRFDSWSTRRLPPTMFSTFLGQKEWSLDSEQSVATLSACHRLIYGVDIS